MAKVKCTVCGGLLDYTKEQAVKSPTHKKRYAHYKCCPDGELVPFPRPKEKTEEDKIFDYLVQIMGKENVNFALVKRQLSNYRKEYNYTDSGMLKCLYYWYDIKKNDPSKAQGGVGIIPYTYQASYNYFYEQWLAQQKNAGKDIKEYIPQEEIIKILNPERPKVKKRKLFAFLDKEGNE